MERLKRLGLTIMILSLFCMINFFTSVFAEEEKAQLLNESVQVSLDEKAAPTSIIDNKLATKYIFETEQTIKVNSNTPIKSIYILFQHTNNWILLYDKQITSCGLYGFLHEYVELTYEQNTVEMKFPKDTVICDIQIYSKGEVRSTVEKWQPPYEDADMLLLPTHADDEHIFFGGIMPYYAGQLNKKVQVAYLTNHKGEWYREHELLEGLWHVGIKAYPVISEFKDLYSESLDHAKKLYNNDEMLAYQVGLLRRFRPEVVIGHDLNGEYGHGVHMLNAHLLIQAITLSNDSTYMPESIKKYETFDVPKTYLHLYDKNQITMKIDEPLTSFHNKTAYEMAKEGFAKHKSQTKYFKVEDKGKYDCRKFGLYRSTVGLDKSGNDFFENIKIEEKPVVNFNKEKTESSNPVTSSTTQVKKEAKAQESLLRTIRGPICVILGIVIILFTLKLSARKRNRLNR